MNRRTLLTTILLAGLSVPVMADGIEDWSKTIAAPADNTKVSRRPAAKERLFYSDTIEKKIAEVKKMLKDAPYLAWMFENCFPNTLDTTVHYSDAEGDDDTFVYTGDIHAMWLRDSGAQVWPYVQFAKKDKKIRKMVRGTILRQLKCICIDPYANAFNMGPTGSEWASDHTTMNPNLHERKYEIDSLCYPLRLAYYYWQVTGDDSIFGDLWQEAIGKILKTFREQQRKNGHGPYRFQRTTAQQYDTVSHGGYGNPVKPVGLIASIFRPSDDATVFPFLIPSNFFAVTSLRKAADILTKVNNDTKTANECTALANEVSAALQQYAIFRGKAGEGIGGPHVGYDMVWPMSIMMRAFTSTDDQEIKECLQMLVDTDAGTGFMHESFNKDNAANYSRHWFAWQNTLFGELILKLIDDGKLNLLKNIHK